MTKLEIIEAQERIIRELAAMNEKLVTALLLQGEDVDDELFGKSEQLRKEAGMYL